MKKPAVATMLFCLAVSGAEATAQEVSEVASQRSEQIVSVPADADSQRRYSPDWQSLQRRQTPRWWRDAKFGIFIHWGVYSVPAYSPVGTYAEWYWERMNFGKPGLDGEPGFNLENSDQVVAFHEATYGPSYPYARFAEDFDARFYDPQAWAKLFERSGAKYVVLTSKHHDGFALWPSEESNRTWGHLWNAASVGPQRDLLGDLTSAVRNRGLKMGVYYSLYEWYNPLYQRDVDTYVDQHMLPQLQDLVTRYNPSIIFADGEWGHPSETWRSEEFLAWLYNREESADVVVNDRWGAETRHNLGGYYTTEYGAGLPNAARPWEESRGMGTSYGYNRMETIDDYKTTQFLVLTLVDTVSRGGNFLLNVGPTSDGRIPVIMQDRLVEIGHWLKVNGDAIYATRPWERSVQWSGGDIPDFEVQAHGFVDYDILKQVFDADEGQASKELFFTQTDDALYIILPKLVDTSLQVENISLDEGSDISVLGAENLPVNWGVEGQGVTVEIPKEVFGLLNTELPIVLRVSAQGKSVPEFATVH